MARFGHWILISIMLTACGVEHDELVSATTEDGQYDATYYFESSGGAVGSSAFALYLSQSEAESKFTDRLLYGRASVSSLEWQDRILTISYTGGEIYEFSSRWMPPGGAHKVELRLNAQCEGICISRLIGPALNAPPVEVREQISSATSPNGGFTALLTRETSSASEASLYRLRIVTGVETEEEKWSTMVLEAKDLKNPILSWDGSRPVLMVSYGGGEITKFQNIWRDGARQSIGYGTYHIEIRLVPTCEAMCF